MFWNIVFWNICRLFIVAACPFGIVRNNLKVENKFGWYLRNIYKRFSKYFTRHLEPISEQFARLKKICVPLPGSCVKKIYFYLHALLKKYNLELWLKTTKTKWTCSFQSVVYRLYLCIPPVNLFSGCIYGVTYCLKKKEYKKRMNNSECSNSPKMGIF